MKITDEMVNAFWDATHADRSGGDAAVAGLSAVAPLIVAEHERLLLEYAWDGRARGAILGAAAELRRVSEPGAHRVDG